MVDSVPSLGVGLPETPLAATHGGTGLATSGSDSTQALKSNGSGGFVMGPVGGAPGGSNGQIQYNNSGALAGLTDAQLTTHIQLFSSTLAGSVPLSGGGTTNFLRADGTWAASGGATANQLTDTVRATLDGGGATVAVGTAIDIVIDYACTIQQVTMLADLSTTSVIDIYKVAFSTTYAPTSGNSICASAKPTLTAAKGSRDSTLTGWTTAVSAGDIIRVIVNSNNSATRLTIGLKVLKS